MTFAELAAGLLLLRIEGAFAIAFLIAVLDILPVLGTGTVLLPWAVIAFAGGNARMGNRGDRAVSDHHSGAQHCGAEAGGKTDGAFSGCDAAVYDCRASFLWNLRTVRRAASGIVFEKTLQ